LLEKKRAKHNIRQKKISSILENLLLNFLPALILTFISISATSFFAIVIFPLQNSFFDLQSIIEVIIKLVIFGVVIWVEAILSRELLNKFKLMRGVIGYWAFLIACFLNLAANIYPEHNLIVSILVTLSAIIYGFWCGPNFRHKPETPFSLLGRLLVSLTVMDFYFMVSKGSYGYGVVVAVLLLFSSMLPLQLKKIENSPWYSRREK